MGGGVHSIPGRTAAIQRQAPAELVRVSSDTALPSQLRLDRLHWPSAFGIGRSRKGLGGVIYLQLRHQGQPATCVLKPCCPSEAAAMKLTARLAGLAGLGCPPVRIVAGPELAGLHRQIQRLARRAEGEGPVQLPPPGRLMAVMEFLQAARLGRGGRVGAPVLAGLGRVLGLDLLCNNWDRIPLGLPSWEPDLPGSSLGKPAGLWQGLVETVPAGNASNVLVTGAGEVYVIDTEVRASASPGRTARYVAEVRGLMMELAGAEARGEIAPAIDRHVAPFLWQRCGLEPEMPTEDGLRVLQTEVLSTAARLSQLSDTELLEMLEEACNLVDGEEDHGENLEGSMARIDLDAETLLAYKHAMVL